MLCLPFHGQYLILSNVSRLSPTSSTSPLTLTTTTTTPSPELTIQTCRMSNSILRPRVPDIDSAPLFSRGIETAKAAARPDQGAMSLEDTIEHAKRAFALRKYEQAVEHYASALELV